MTRKTLVIAGLYLIPFSMLYGAIELSAHYNAVGVIFGFIAGIAYAAVRAVQAEQAGRRGISND